MEDALRALHEGQIMTVAEVLILVLMEDALREYPIDSIVQTLIES